MAYGAKQMDDNFKDFWIDGPSAAGDFEVRHGERGTLVAIGFSDELDAQEWIDLRWGGE